MAKVEESVRGKLNLEDLKSLLWTTLIFGLATVVTYLSSHLGVLHLSPDYEALAVFLLGLLGKLLQKLVAGK